MFAATASAVHLVFRGDTQITVPHAGNLVSDNCLPPVVLTSDCCLPPSTFHMSGALVGALGTTSRSRRGNTGGAVGGGGTHLWFLW